MKDLREGMVTREELDRVFASQEQPLDLRERLDWFEQNRPGQ